MDRLDAMHLFVRVAELGSFAAAAQQTGLARSVVTRQIAALENHLGCKLMARSTRRLTLTSAGTAYLEKCRVILNLVEAAETDIAAERQTPRGQIRVASPLSFGLKRVAPWLLEFASMYPEVSLDMDYSDRRMNLIEEGVDLSIRITRRLASGDITRKLGVSRMKLVASPDYLARHGRPQKPEDLSHHEYLGYTLTGATGVQFIVDRQRVRRVARRVGRRHAALERHLREITFEQDAPRPPEPEEGDREQGEEKDPVQGDACIEDHVLLRCARGSARVRKVPQKKSPANAAGGAPVASSGKHCRTTLPISTLIA